MRIACPSCDAVYEVPDAMLSAAPRAVRCARCGTEWMPQPLPDPAPVEAVADVAPAPSRSVRVEPKLSSYRTRTQPRASQADDGDARPAPRDDETTLRRRRGALIGWALSLLLLIALAIAAVAWRTDVMAAWPPSQRVYGALGLR